MRATGIVRRIDDLGRVVIPRELRKTLNLREGDPLEIFTDKDGCVIFKKYMVLENWGDLAKTTCESLLGYIGKSVAICSKNAPMFASGANAEKVMSERISYDLLNEMKKSGIPRDTYFLGDEQVLWITPIFCGNENVGAIIVTGQQPTSADIICLNFASALIEKTMHQ